MGRGLSILGGTAVTMLAVGHFAYGIRHGGAARDVSSTRIHVNSFPYSYGSKYIWLEPGEKLRVHYKLSLDAGSAEVYVNDGAPWKMSDKLYAHLSLAQSGEGDWAPETHPGWNHILLGSRNGKGSDRQFEYTFRWRVE